MGMARGRMSVLMACVLGIAGVVQAQQRPSAKMLQFPAVSAKEIVFLYANDLWLVPREGGVARPLASPPGREMFPKFSPDGTHIAFVGNYDGGRDIYVVPVEGGPPRRVTHHPSAEVVSGWTPDGHILYYAADLAGLQRQEQIFAVSAEGGMPERLPVPYGTTGAVSPDGQWLAYTPSTVDFRTWKRYRGGWAQDIWLFSLRDHSSKKITDWEGTDTIPMWQPRTGERLYYLSDNGPEHRLNIWSYAIRTGEREQVTDFKDYDVKWPSIGPGDRGQGEIVFQVGEELMLLDLGSKRSRRVEVIIPGDRPRLRVQAVDASKFIQRAVVSPSGKRVGFEARGDIWSVPAVEGASWNLTRTSGVAERDPLFSPDGKWIAYLSDETGEYEVALIDADGKERPRQLTTGGTCYRYLRSWSPDSKHLVFTDKTGAVFLHTLGGKDHDGSEPGQTKQIATEPWADQEPIVWSHDSAWLALVLGHENTHDTIRLYEVATGALTQVTSEMFISSWPAFDRKGDWLYFISGRHFQPTYSDLDSTWVYRNSRKIYAVPLRKDVKNPLSPKNDQEEAKKDEKDEKQAGEKKDRAPYAGTWRGTARVAGEEPFEVTLKIERADDGTIGGTASALGEEFAIRNASWDAESKTLTFEAVGPDATYTVKATIAGNTLKAEWTTPNGETGTIEAKREEEETKVVVIELEGFERRAIEVPVRPGGLSNLAVNDAGKLVYLRTSEPAGDEPPGAPANDIKIFDLHDEKSDKKEEKTVLAGVNTFQMSADGKKLLVRRRDEYAVIDAAADQKFDKKVPLGAMSTPIDPREEWRQVFTDLWRIFRDYFYEPGLHKVDWSKQRDAYARLLEHCAGRDDVSYVMAEMISEFNVGHAYYRPGDLEQGPAAVGVGLLGADYELTTQDGITAYRIVRILEGGAWDADARGPLSQPGVDVRVGDFLLAVNRVPIDVSKDVWAAFVGTAGQATLITVNDRPVIDDTAREFVVKPLSSEATLRLRAWIEDNRRYVNLKSEGKIGYVYVINTGVPGQSDLVRQFYGQRHKAALIIDDRWNGGGQIPTRFIELLNRPRTNYWARRDGLDWAWPRDSHQGPKCMLINGLSASGGDMFPALFRQAGLGKLIGMRTWGGLVGISGNPRLIDGTMPNVPTFGYYERDGTWGIEGHGVDPDIEVIDDPAKMIAPPGSVADPQLDAAIAHLLGEIETRGYHPPPKPAGPDRSGMGIPPADR